LNPGTIPNNVRIAVRENNNVAGSERNHPAVIQTGKPLPLGKEVVDDHMSVTHPKMGRQGTRRRGKKAPGCRKLAVKVDCAVELDHLQNFGKNIHSNFSAPPPDDRQSLADEWAIGSYDSAT